MNLTITQDQESTIRTALAFVVLCRRSRIRKRNHDELSFQNEKIGMPDSMTVVDPTFHTTKKQFHQSSDMTNQNFSCPAYEGNSRRQVSINMISTCLPGFHGMYNCLSISPRNDKVVDSSSYAARTQFEKECQYDHVKNMIQVGISTAFSLYPLNLRLQSVDCGSIHSIGSNIHGSHTNTPCLLYDYTAPSLSPLEAITFVANKRSAETNAGHGIDPKAWNYNQVRTDCLVGNNSHQLLKLSSGDCGDFKNICHKVSSSYAVLDGISKHVSLQLSALLPNDTTQLIRKGANDESFIGDRECLALELSSFDYFIDEILRFQLLTTSQQMKLPSTSYHFNQWNQSFYDPSCEKTASFTAKVMATCTLLHRVAYFDTGDSVSARISVSVSRALYRLYYQGFTFNTTKEGEGLGNIFSELQSNETLFDYSRSGPKYNKKVHNKNSCGYQYDLACRSFDNADLSSTRLMDVLAVNLLNLLEAVTTLRLQKSMAQPTTSESPAKFDRTSNVAGSILREMRQIFGVEMMVPLVSSDIPCYVVNDKGHDEAITFGLSTSNLTLSGSKLRKDSPHSVFQGTVKSSRSWMVRHDDKSYITKINDRDQSHQSSKSNCESSNLFPHLGCRMNVWSKVMLRLCIYDVYQKLCSYHLER